MSAGNINITAEEDGSQKKSLGSSRSVVELYSHRKKRTNRRKHGNNLTYKYLNTDSSDCTDSPWSP